KLRALIFTCELFLGCFDEPFGKYPKVYAYYASVSVRFESLNSNTAPGGSFNDLHKRLISRTSVDVILNSSDEVSAVKVVAIGVLADRFDFLYVFRSQVLFGSSWNFYVIRRRNPSDVFSAIVLYVAVDADYRTNVSYVMGVVVPGVFLTVNYADFIANFNLRRCILIAHLIYTSDSILAANYATCLLKLRKLFDSIELYHSAFVSLNFNRHISALLQE